MRFARLGSPFLRRFARSLALLELAARFGARELRRFELAPELHGASLELGRAAQRFASLLRRVESRAALAESLARHLFARCAVGERRFRLGEREPGFVLEALLGVAPALGLAELGLERRESRVEHARAGLVHARDLAFEGACILHLRPRPAAGVEVRAHT